MLKALAAMASVSSKVAWSKLPAAAELRRPSSSGSA
jgi:hypothetical protein